VKVKMVKPFADCFRPFSSLSAAASKRFEASIGGGGSSKPLVGNNDASCVEQGAGRSIRSSDDAIGKCQ